MKRQRTEWKKTFANNVTDNGLILYKQLTVQYQTKQKNTHKNPTK